MKMFKGLIAGLSAVLLFSSCQPAFAYVDESKVQEQEDSETQPAKEETAEQTGDDLRKEDDSKDESAPENESGVLTPEGELDLVDDLTGDETGDLQYMTVQSKDGTVFYLIVDHSSQSQNVYFLNQVDASDLLAIMNDEEIDAYEESLKEKEESEAPVVQPEAVKKPEMETEEPAASNQDEKTDDNKGEQKKKNASAIPLAAVLGVIAAGVLAGYYFFKIRPERNGSRIDRMEFEDDEYIDDGPVEPDE